MSAIAANVGRLSERLISPIRTLHEAVTLAGIADMGPMLPMLTNIGEEHHAQVGEAARALLAHDEALA